jgi:hypothetical protein
MLVAALDTGGVFIFSAVPFVKQGCGTPYALQTLERVTEHESAVDISISLTSTAETL